LRKEIISGTTGEQRSMFSPLD